ncbi:MAG TPA: cell division topological specificity factor MinE [Candidatus Baltobacteraceae bacterium]|jgi:cell division topological specificity factor|nr:cell division topological specificity factor MinE [Candidatus Baltobacteraceae bacterium]
MIEFFNRLFGRQSSGATAKERLRLVLMSDHLSLAPEMIDAMKRDLVDVISKYVEVDRDKIDVHFEHQDRALAMLANIPITGVSRNGASNGTNGTNGHYSNGHSPVHAEPAPSHAEPAASTEPGRGSESPNAGEVPSGDAQPVSGHAQPVAATELGTGSAPPSAAEISPAKPKPKPVTAKNAARPRRKRRKTQQ